MEQSNEIGRYVCYQIPMEIEVIDTCGFIGKPSPHDILQCVDERESYFSWRSQYHECIEERCGPRPPIDATRKIWKWMDCVEMNTGQMLRSADFDKSKKCESFPFKRQACALESAELCIEAMARGSELWFECFKQIEAYDACIEDKCGPRPSGGETKAWEVCAAVYTRLDGESPDSSENIPYSLMQFAGMLLGSDAIIKAKARALIEVYVSSK